MIVNHLENLPEGSKFYPYKFFGHEPTQRLVSDGAHNIYFGTSPYTIHHESVLGIRVGELTPIEAIDFLEELKKKLEISRQAIEQQAGKPISVHILYWSTPTISEKALKDINETSGFSLEEVIECNTLETWYCSCMYAGDKGITVQCLGIENWYFDPNAPKEITCGLNIDVYSAEFSGG